ncbi:MAG: M10 family metallopeptidase C-terminal domain-containing protein [Pseudomonadota bacterium]
MGSAKIARIAMPASLPDTLATDSLTNAESQAATGTLIGTPTPFLFDTIPGNTGTSATLTVGAAPTISAIDTIGDQDFYAVQLVAGHQYNIGLFGYIPHQLGDPLGPTGIPLLDSYVELYDASGNLITAADGGSDTVLNSANSGFDALLTFSVTTSGTYYVNARAFDNIAQDGTDGDMVGDYGVYVQDVTGDESLYTPYYEPSSPLYAIDWGTQVDGTVRNPDGVETGHTTGNSIGTADNPYGYDVPGKNVVTIYFAKAGDIFVSNDLTNPGLPPATVTATGVQEFERTAVLTALGEFSKVADVVYVEVQDRDQANFIYTSYIGTPGPGVSLLGSMSPPGESDEGLAQFNSGDYRWNATDLQQGGFSFVTLIHEFGHGHGLAHPHDNGGHSGIMNGVETEGAGVADYTTGDYHLNQAVFTMMSYEDGWVDSPYGNAETNVGYGYLGGLMAFDIAAIQDKYGVNEDTATGNDTYILKDVNAAGTYFSSIWDAAGNDTIAYSGSRDTTIDLRPATLEYEVGGGGNVSYAYGIFGGFTIANGVVIENATGGSGNDTLTGNDAANLLIGGAGNDVLTGGLGNDKLRGGLGDDSYYVEGNNDVIQESSDQGTDTVFSSGSFSMSGIYVENLTLTGTADINGTGTGYNNVITGNSGANILDGGAGADSLIGGLGDDTYVVDNAGDTVTEAASAGHDTVRSSINYSLAGTNIEDLVLTGTAKNGIGSDGDNRLTGNDAANNLTGGAGSDVLDGAGGIDTLRGGIGDDTYYTDGSDIIYEGFNEGTDTVISSGTFSMSGIYVENLTLTGSAAINGTGTGYANTLTGNSGANRLDGGGGNDKLYGGLGNDVLIGGAGQDGFYFDTAAGAGNWDDLQDFSHTDDTIYLDRDVFTGIGADGQLDINAFRAGSTAVDADDRILYDSATGNIYYDADGVGGADAVLMAHVAAGTTVNHTDFSGF